MNLTEAQKAFTQSMRSKHPNLFPEKDQEDYAINRYGIEIFPGWFPIIEDMIDQIAAYAEQNELVASLQITQIKTDFCLLRCNTTIHDDALDDIIVGHKEQASRTCEQCGNPGEIRIARRWKTVLCDSCAAHNDKEQ